MDGEIDAAVEQRIFEFFGEHTLAADHRQRIRLHVAGGLDDVDADVDFRKQRMQAGFRLFSLPECELRSAGTDYEATRHTRSILEIKNVSGRRRGVRLAASVKTTHLVQNRVGNLVDGGHEQRLDGGLLLVGEWSKSFALPRHLGARDVVKLL